MKKFYLYLLIIFTTTATSQQKYLKDLNEVRDLSINSTKLFYDYKITDCFNLLSEYWPMPSNEIESLENQTIKYVNIFDERYGKKNGFELIKTEKISDFALRETYIIKYEFTAIRLIYTYFKNDKGWIINAFKWDDSFSEEF